MLINHPILGPSDAAEFVYLGDAYLINRPDWQTENTAEKFYEYHSEGKFDITLVVATKKHSLSYGSCQLDRAGNFKKIIEKPYTNHLVNIGLYLLKPSIIKMVSKNESISMDGLLTRAKKRNKKIGVFPVSENNWNDVGAVSYTHLTLPTNREV